LAAFIRREKGVIVLPEVKALIGSNQEAAEQLFADCVVRFNGRAEISEEGVLFGSFPDLRLSVDQSQDEAVEWFWDEYEPEYHLTGNSRARNWTISAVNAFNLMFALMLSGFFALSSQVLFFPGEAFILGWMQVLFSALFFIIPLGRWRTIKRNNKARFKRNLQRRLMYAIFQNLKDELTLQEITAAINQSPKGEDKMSPEEIQAEMERFLEDWGVEKETAPDGNHHYRFPDLLKALETGQKLRAQAGPLEIGNIIIETST
jgi:hypothetical protein